VGVRGDKGARPFPLDNAGVSPPANQQEEADMEEDTKAAVRRLSARMYALQAGVIALIQTHPEPQALHTAIDANAEDPLAILLNTQWPEADLKVFRSTIALLQSKIAT
jgi:hypothetical protein